MFGWVIGLTLTGAAISYAHDIGLHQRVIEEYHRWLYSHDGRQVVDQWWQNDKLYTTSIDRQFVEVNGERVAGARDWDYPVDACRYARMWVDAQEGT